MTPHVRRWSALCCAAFFLAAPVVAKEKNEANRIKPSEDRLRTDISYLASPNLEGRGPATRGLDLAADYIAREFRKAGLKPGNKDGTYFQRFTVAGNIKTGPASLVLRGPQGQEIVLREGLHFNASGLSPAGALKDIPVVFAGFGVRTSEQFGYDDYKGLNVAGKAVIFIRDTPNSSNTFLSFDGAARIRHASFTTKAELADKLGALALFYVNELEVAQTGDDLHDFNYFAPVARGAVKLPMMHFRRSVVDLMLHSVTTRSLDEIEQQINRTLKPASVELKGWTVSLEIKAKRDRLDVRNVVGVLEGNGPLADETIIIGAHYDHVGYGAQSSMARPKKMMIHHGADDNASGTVSVLELARRLAAIPNRQGRRLVFITFSAEEMGLIGSRHYVANPIFPLNKTVAMINLDMVGRSTLDNQGRPRVQVLGMGSAKEFDALLDAHNRKHNLAMTKTKGSRGDSDHWPFYQNKVPILFFFTGMHPDYHRPTDTWEKINVPAMRQIVDMVEGIALELASKPEKPTYVQVRQETGRPRTPGIRLGIQPAYNDAADGLLIEGVTEGGLAARAGIKAGDRIVEMNGKPVKKIEDYMTILADVKRTEPLKVGVLRDKKKLTIDVKLD